jgi:hypothetical protein
MKYRTEFVSNSSSTSYIIALPSTLDVTIWRDQIRQFVLNPKKYIFNVGKDQIEKTVNNILRCLQFFQQIDIDYNCDHPYSEAEEDAWYEGTSDALRFLESIGAVIDTIDGASEDGFTVNVLGSHTHPKVRAMINLASLNSKQA